MAKTKKQTSLKPSIQIFELSIDDVKPYANNPRFNEDAVPGVMESLKEFGWRQPIVVSVRQGNEIVVGHTRVEAAKRLGWKSVPCIDASDLDDRQIRAYRLADNKTNEGASWDDMKLDAELDSLMDFDMERFGFKMPDDGDLDGAFDGDDGMGAYKDADKVNFKIPIEHLEQVRKWLREGGRKKTIRWILVQSGCIAEDEDVEIEDDGEEES